MRRQKYFSKERGVGQQTRWDSFCRERCSLVQSTHSCLLAQLQTLTTQGLSSIDDTSFDQEMATLSVSDTGRGFERA
jgi:hypothetical protein